MNSIKIFPEYTRLTINLKADFLRAYEFVPPHVSDIVFNTLFGWTDYYNYKVSSYGDFIFVHYTSEGKMMVLMPLETSRLSVEKWRAEFAGLSDALNDYCKKTGDLFEFSGIPDSFIKKLPSHGFKARLERDCFDYVYKRQDLAGLNGSAYAPKRNLIKQFEKNNKYVYKPLSTDNISECEAFIRGWEVSKVKNAVIGTGAYCMACRLMENYEKLDLCGGMIYIDGKVVAATVASIVRDFSYENGTHPTAVVHHENGMAGLKGVHQVINWQFANSLPKDVEYINREEDLGIEGLRKAKMSYNPAMLINKSIVIYNHE